MSQPQLGKLIKDSENIHDAIHVAIRSVFASEDLNPADHVGLIDIQHAGKTDDPIGIVDPYLTEPVKKGQKFLLCVYPNTITDMRHSWSHPALTRLRYEQRTV